MKSIVQIKDKKVIDSVNLEDGQYRLSIEKVCDSKTLEQTRKLWATCSDISQKLYGNKSEKESVYIQILKMAGQRTFKLMIMEDAIEDLKKQKGVKCISVLSRDVINHTPYAYIDVCMTGISDMDKKEVSQVIDCACKYADEVGVIPQIERSQDGN